MIASIISKRCLPSISFRYNYKCTNATHHRTIATTTTASSTPTKPNKRIAVIGAGFAGVAVSFHLLKLSLLKQQQQQQEHPPIQVDPYDAYSLGAGGSGAAAGLLHPYSPKGKVLWKGKEAYREAVALVREAEEAGCPKGRQFVWRRGLLRAAKTKKQAVDFVKNAGGNAEARLVYTYEELKRIVPGIRVVGDLAPEGNTNANLHPQQQQQSWAVGLLAEQAIVVHPTDYIEAVWRVCEEMAGTQEDGCRVQIHFNTVVTSLRELQRQHNYDGIIVAAGAAIDSIQETKNLLPLDLCHGHSVDVGIGADDMEKEKKKYAYPEHAPGLLGSPYISPQGGTRAVVGATQRHACSPQEAFLGLSPDRRVLDRNKDREEWNGAVRVLIDEGACTMWDPIREWRVDAVRTGFRAVPARTDQGAMPYAGRIDGNENWWVIGGLGARGLVYHAWLGKLVAAAVWSTCDDDDEQEELFPRELLRWKRNT